MIKVIHVEDDDDIRELVELSLKISGEFEVLSCASGIEAMSAVEAFKPDLLLLDVMMPNMNGVETLENIRNLEGFSMIPAIFVTARAGVDQNQAVLKAGALGVIVKPFDPLELGGEVKTLFSDASMSS
ncbi:response regulator [Sulfitobacter sp. UBA1132]|uniref:response regulator n=1 Tax=Sulfitobacter sp. UBA1132 TaxID=1947582 RepID=UPI00257BA3FB|nr:response regulator [Sulfitobacter sp. UBA1132]